MRQVKKDIIEGVAKANNISYGHCKSIYESQFKVVAKKLEENEEEVVRIPRIGKLIKKEKKDVR